MTPAAPNTYVVEVNPTASEGVTKTPVICWDTSGKRPTPVTVHGIQNLIGGSAILFPCGMVHSPLDALAYEDLENWLESNPGTPKKHPAPANAKAPAPASSEGCVDISWSDATFKNNSFWHYDDGHLEFVFQIDGGEPLPVASKIVVKIKRDDFMTMKKAVDVWSVDDIKNPSILPDPEVDEDDIEDGADDDGEDLL